MPKTRKKSKPLYLQIGGAILFAACSALPIFASGLPVDLPDPEPTDRGDKTKPVKVYIQSGQSNSLGFGRIEGAAPFYTKVFLSADPSVIEGTLPIENTAILRFGVFQSEKPDAPTGAIARVFSGAYDPKVDSRKLKPSFEKSVALGHSEAQLPEVSGPTNVLVKAFIEVPFSATYHVHPGTGSSAQAIAMVNGQEVYRKEANSQAVLSGIKLEKGKRHPIEITFLDQGQASLWLEMVDLKGMGDLKFVVNELGRFPQLIDKDGNWTERKDVMLNNAYMGKGTSKPLSPGTIGKAFGPELGFGYVMGTFHDEPVIIIKADIGNRSLGWDILPPGSKRYTFEGREQPGYKEMLDANGKVVPWDGKGWYAGKQYDDYTDSIHTVLNAFKERYPEYADQGFEVAGFLWFQGHKDAGNAAHTAKYEENLANLIVAWRKEFNAPNAKWAIATGCGSRGDEGNAKIVYEAQLKVANPERHPEFAGNVKTIDTRPFWRDAEVSPTNQSYHYNHNAETYMLVGDALGRAMVELHGGTAQYPDPKMPDTVASLPSLPTLTGEELDKMRPALRPIILDKIIPDYVASAANVPGYLRRGLELKSIVENKAPAKPSAELASQLDKLIDFYQLAGIAGYEWQPIDPEMRFADWHYHSFDPPEKKTDVKGDRYRPITLPEGMEKWTSPEFNAAQFGWKIGKAPFGQNNGKLAALRKQCGHPQCHCDGVPNTLWEKEVLLIRGQFKMPPFEDGKRYRIVVGGGNHVWEGEGFALYLNGQQIAEMKGGYYKSGGDPRGAYIFDNLRPQVENKMVTVAVKAFLRQSGHRDKAAPPTGHLSVWLEEAKLPPVLLDTTEGGAR